MLLGSVHHSFLYKPVLIPPADPFIHYPLSFCVCLFSLSLLFSYSSFLPFQPALPFLILTLHTHTHTHSLSLCLSQLLPLSVRVARLPSLSSLSVFSSSSLDGPLQSAFLTSCSLLTHPPIHLIHTTTSTHHFFSPSSPLSLCQDSSFVLSRKNII